MNDGTLRLMAVFAHPDDESLGMAGVLPKYAAEGVEIALVTATRGERGRYGDLRLKDPGHPGIQAMAGIRERELREAAAVLGIRELHLLDYVDGELDQADPREAIGRIAAHIRRLRPHVVVTFPSDGGYGHPDHIAISQFTGAAVVRAASAENGAPGHEIAKLYHLTESEASWNLYQRVFKKLTSVVDGVERVAVPWPEWAITTTIDARDHWAIAWKAVQCHHTQIGNYAGIRSLGPDEQRELWGWRRFYRVLSMVNGGRKAESDFFEGLR